MNAIGSSGLKPNSAFLRTRLAGPATAIPMAIPTATNLAPCPITRNRTSRFVAPSAIRIPISFVRWLTDAFSHRARGDRGAHDQIPANVPIGRTEGVWPIEERPDFFSQTAQADVTHDADDLPSVFLFGELLAKRIFVRKILARQRLVDYGDGRSRRGVALIEEASADERNSHGVKIMWRAEVKVGRVAWLGPVHATADGEKGVGRPVS